MTVNAEQVTLFVVEDDDVDYLTIQRSFKKKRIANNILRAKDGIEALEILRKGQLQRPFIMLLDLQMPRMTGIELLSELRNDSQLQDTTVFVLTTSSDEKDILNSYQFNVAGYFVKDEAGSEFLNIVTLLNGYWKVVHLPTQ